MDQWMTPFKGIYNGTCRLHRNQLWLPEPLTTAYNGGVCNIIWKLNDRIVFYHAVQKRSKVRLLSFNSDVFSNIKIMYIHRKPIRLLQNKVADLPRTCSEWNRVMRGNSIEVQSVSTIPIMKVHVFKREILMA
ncbi:hypothetical protein CAPTEDRAFT_225111 [Capitella teleta]|uniref:Uncharacterized protein n=1 Tax=Capitella teleta TaxID=283909 RepID=R7T9U8_CAPTE|nr:hypothetical protein CAPTEDRAFT_225111 [Capitella teleta]|eukprot:ELT90282.1 hypothetical protein CAPTEDRAFT_225111 [Capitella teleta]